MLMPAAHRRSELCPFSAAFPRCLRKTLGSPSQAAGLVCTRRVFYSTLGKDTFSPSFRLLMAAEGAGNFTRAPSHRQPNPTSPGSPGMRVTAPAWLWLQIFTAAPARAHLPRGPVAWLGRGLAPGSMKARVVRRSAGASGIQRGCSTSFYLPIPHRAARPLPKTALLICGCQLQGCIAQRGGAREPPAWCSVIRAMPVGTSLPSTSTKTHHKPLKRKEGNNFGGQTGLPGKGRAKPVIPHNPGIPGLFMHRPFHTQHIPAGFLSSLLFNSPAQEARSLTAWLMSTEATDPFG